MSLEINGTETKNQQKKQGRSPQERSGRQAEIPPHGEDGDIGLLHAERQDTERGHIRRGVPAPLHEGRAGEGTAQAGAHELCLQTLRNGEQSEPACHCAPLRQGASTRAYDKNQVLQHPRSR